MKIVAQGFLTNGFNEVLLFRDAQEAWRLPGGVVNAGDLPAIALAEQVKAQTGIFVIPIRLVGVYTTAVDTLTLLFRCLQKGGQLPEEEKESQTAGFCPVSQLPQPLAPHQARLLQDAGQHAGGAPICAALAGSTIGDSNPLKWVQNVWHKWRGTAVYESTDHTWQLDVLVILDDNTLLGHTAVDDKTPWHTAEQLIPSTATLGRISGIYITPSQPPRLTITFTAVGTDSQHASLPHDTPLHHQALTDYRQDPHTTHFALIHEP